MLATVDALVGIPVTVRGYAQDFASPVAGMQFSCDDGATWTTYPVEAADVQRNVNWSFCFTPPRSGSYLLHVRAVTADGRTTPEAAFARIEAREDVR